MRKASLHASNPSEKEEEQLGTVSDGRLVSGTVHDYYRDMSWLADAIHVRDVDENFPAHERLKYAARLLGEKEFLLMMLRIAPYYSFSRIDKFRSAVAHFQLRLKGEGHLMWTQTKSFTRDLKGLTAICQRPGTRGAILYAHLNVLLEYTANVGFPEYVWGFIVAHAALLRHTELMKLAADCVVFPDRGAPVLRIVGGKGDRHDMAEDEEHGLPEGEQFVRADGEHDVPGTLRLLLSLSKGGLLFPTWNRHVANKIIQECAQAHHWPDKVKWSFHCLRHGKCAQMKMDGVDLAERMLRGRWKSRDVCEDYSKVNGE